MGRLGVPASDDEVQPSCMVGDGEAEEVDEEEEEEEDDDDDDEEDDDEDNDEASDDEVVVGDDVEVVVVAEQPVVAGAPELAKLVPVLMGLEVGGDREADEEELTDDWPVGFPVNSDAELLAGDGASGTNPALPPVPTRRVAEDEGSAEELAVLLDELQVALVVIAW